MVYSSRWIPGIQAVPKTAPSVDVTLLGLKRIVEDTSYGNYWNRLDAIRKLGKIKTKDSMDILIDLLGDKEPPIREAAVIELAKLTDEPLKEQFCKKSMTHPNLTVRLYATWVLRYLKNRITLPYLVNALKHNDPAFLVGVIDALSGFPSADIPYEQIIKKLTHAQPVVKASAVKALSSSPEAVSYTALTKKLKDPSPEVRAAAVESLSKVAGIKSKDAVLRALKDSDYRVRISALESLAQIDVTAALDAACNLLRDSDWRVRAAAVGVLSKLGTQGCIEPLRQQLSKETGRLRHDITDAILSIRKARAIITDETAVSVPMTESAFYEIPIYGKNIKFIIDFSGSMKNKDKTGQRKIDTALAELGIALRRLDPKTKFDIILMSTEATVIKERHAFGRLTLADPLHVDTALKWVSKIWGRLETVARGRGDIYDAIKEAFAQTDIDTIFLLSDGVATYGQYIEEQNILEHLRDVNRFRKVVINTILTGETGVAVNLMKGIAELTGGMFMRR